MSRACVWCGSATKRPDLATCSGECLSSKRWFAAKRNRLSLRLKKRLAKPAEHKRARLRRNHRCKTEVGNGPYDQSIDVGFFQGVRGKDRGVPLIFVCTDPDPRHSAQMRTSVGSHP